ncbi:MAG: helix-turn-helix domain-containing protein [Actinomycetota bacterium]|nr:helix-turn-helix domain-containing protein [Actinomycetota bacterium]
MAERVTQDDVGQLLTYAEAAHFLRVSERTLQRYIADEKVPVVRLPKGSPRIRRVDLDAMVDGGAA